MNVKLKLNLSPHPLKHLNLLKTKNKIKLCPFLSLQRQEDFSQMIFTKNPQKTLTSHGACVIYIKSK